MSSLETLPNDQRAVLELVLRRGRTYDQIATMLGIDRAGVRDRALAALDALGPETPISDERRHLITDYLLSALPRRVAEEVRNLLASSPPERAWARVVASELEPIASSPIPEIPVDGGTRMAAPARESAAAAAEPGVPAPTRPRPRERERPPRERPPREPERRPLRPPAPPGARRPSSRRGGAVVLWLGGLLAVAVVVVLVVVLTGGGSSKKPTGSRLATHPATTASTTKTSTTGSGAQILAQLNLNPPNGGKAKGVAFVVRVSGRLGLEIRASGLAPNTVHPPNAYAVWLFNSPGDSQILGFVNPGVGQNGSFETIGPLPSNTAHFHNVLVTLETTSNPKSPGTIVLRAPLTGAP
jgi:hypothetical protein